jgi:peptidyl-prolyl cis-trans isomerase SurA
MKGVGRTACAWSVLLFWALLFAPAGSSAIGEDGLGSAADETVEATDDAGDVVVEEIDDAGDVLVEESDDAGDVVVEEIDDAGDVLDDADLVDGIAAQVGAEIVLISEVRNLVGPMEARLIEMGASQAELAAVRADALERLIERALIRQVVRRAELEATDVEIDAAIAAIAEENDLTMNQLLATVESEGLPFEIYRDRIRGEIEQTKVLQGMVASRVRLEEEDVRAAYDERFEDQPSGGTEVHLRHIVVPFLNDDELLRSAACREAERAREQLATGASFQLVASELSPEAAQASRDLGWIHQSSLASWMAAQVIALDAAGVTDVIRTDFGCNVIELVERRSFEPRSYEDVKEQLYDRLFALEMQEEYVEFMERLRESTYIERKGVFADAARLSTGEATPGRGGP